MNRLNEILRELGISKVKLAKFLGVSRQMIYNYLDLDDINKWPKDKKVLLFNLLGIKSAEEVNDIKVNTDYIIEVEARINALFNQESKDGESNDEIQENSKISSEKKELLDSIVDLLKEKLEDDNKEDYVTCMYIYHLLQAIDSSKEIKYILGYIVKATGFVQPLDYAYDEEEQFLLESFMFSAMTLYNNRNGVSKSKIAESHRRFVSQIEHKMEDKQSRTMELNTIKIQALKELGYTEITESNAAEVFEKIAEIQSRTVN